VLNGSQIGGGSIASAAEMQAHLWRSISDEEAKTRFSFFLRHR
jgi:aspartyl-tRNA synthetase